MGARGSRMSTGPQQTAAFLFEEAIDKTWSLRTELKQIYFTGQSEWQKVQVIETAAFGRTLVMDDKTQSAELDEKVYHESLVHPAMLLQGNPKSVFIGGGDGAYEDPRFEVYYEDAKAWIENCGQKFDVIIMDICDPIEAGPGIALYFSEFYTYCKENVLNPGGVLVTQSGCCGINNYKECYTTINSTLNSSFAHVAPYSAPVASFGCPWGFNLPFD